MIDFLILVNNHRLKPRLPNDILWQKCLMQCARHTWTSTGKQSSFQGLVWFCFCCLWRPKGSTLVCLQCPKLGTESSAPQAAIQPIYWPFFQHILRWKALSACENSFKTTTKENNSLWLLEMGSCLYQCCRHSSLINTQTIPHLNNIFFKMEQFHYSQPQEIHTPDSDTIKFQYQASKLLRLKKNKWFEVSCLA